MAMSIDTGININLSVSNAAQALHKDRPEEIEELPAYVSATASSPENLMLVNVQEDTPGVSARPYPWIKLDANGYPVANPVYVWHTGDAAWVNAAP